MKIIDTKGRLFGKINIIDFLVILFLVYLIPMFYFGYKSINKKSKSETSREALKKESEKEFIEIELNCLFIKLDPKIAEIISIGDRELDLQGNPIAEVISLGKISPYFYQFDIGGNEKLYKTDPLLQQRPALLKMKAEIRQNYLYYKDTQILKNGNIEFATDIYQIKAVLLLVGDKF